MKNLIYGCSKNLKFILEKFDVDYSELEFTDSCSLLWGTEYIRGKCILPNIQINRDEFDFCVIGSRIYSDEIREEILKLGFDNKHIIPFEYINSIWERWKKGVSHKLWCDSIEDKNISIVKNWYMNGSDAVCIIKIQNLLYYNIQIKAFDIYVEPRRIEVYDISNDTLLGSFEARKRFTFCNIANETLIKVVVKQAVVGIPWCMISYQKSEQLCEVNSCKLGKQLLNTYRHLQEFPYYDEDYTVISCVKNYAGTILDVGANYGQSMFSFYNLSKSNIVSIEVRPDLYETLLEMKRLIDNEGRIRVINSGVSDKEEELVWYEPVDPIMSGSFDTNFIHGRNLDVEIVEKTMKCRPLDDLLETYEDIWFVKMDVEGLEYEALKGCKKIISQNHPLILVEQNEKLFAIKELLSDEYDVFYYDLYMDRFVDKRLSRLNCWLIPKEKYRSDIVRKIIDGRM